MYKGKLQDLLEEKRYDLVFVALNPEEASIETRGNAKVLFPYDFSKLEVIAAENDKDRKCLVQEAEKLGAPAPNLLMSVGMFRNDITYIFSGY